MADKERNIEDINDVDRQKYDLFERDKNESYIHPISFKRESPLYSHVLTQQQREYVVTTLTKEFPSEEESFRELYLDPNSKLGNISHLSPEQPAPRPRPPPRENRPPRSRAPWRS